MGLFDRFKKSEKEKSVKTKARKRSVRSTQVSVQKQKPGKVSEKIETVSKIEKQHAEPLFLTKSIEAGQVLGHEKTHEKLDTMDKKLDELIEIKGLYNDMLDWLVEISRKNKGNLGDGGTDMSPMVTDKSKSIAILSPRLRQVLDVVEERGEILAEDVSHSTGLSINRCSELLNALYKADYIEKNRAGRKVFFRANKNRGPLTSSIQ